MVKTAKGGRGESCARSSTTLSWFLRLIAVVCAGAGVALAVMAFSRQGPDTPPTPSASDAVAAPPDRSTGLVGHARGMKRSLPLDVTIPAINVRGSIITVGENRDGTIETPPFERDAKVGWYRYSPTPGQLGTSILLAHVDSAQFGPGVFYRLGDVRRGDTVRVDRADHSAATFRVYRVAMFPKSRFPTKTVYGKSAGSELRLITCGGTFDSSTRSYQSNVVVFARAT